MTFTLESRYPYVLVKIDGFLHIKFRMREFVGVQSYLENSNLYCIELYFKNDVTILLEYDNQSKWTEVLNLLESI